MKKFRLYFVFSFVLVSYCGWGQISITSLPYSPTVTEFNSFNPNSLSNLNSTIPPGWSGSSTGSQAPYRGQGTGTGNNNTDGFWGFGANADFSLGAERNGGGNTYDITYSVSYINNTTCNITSLSFSWNYEQWRYKNTSGWNCTGTGALSGNTQLDSKDFVGSGSGTDGTSTTTSMGSFTLTGLNIAVGSSFGVSWNTTDPNNPDNGISIDDFNISAQTTPSIIISANPGNQICSGTNVTFTANPFNGGSSPSYQWKVNGTNVGTGTIYSSTSLADADQVTCTLSSSCSATAPTSNVIAMIVNPSTVGGGVAGGSTPICPGISTGILSLSGNLGTILKWQKSLNGGAWTDISNITTNYSEIPSSVGTWSYRAVVQNGACAEANSIQRDILVNAFTNTWTGALNANWNTSGNWQCGVVPNSTTADVTLPNGSFPVLDVDVTLRNLTMLATSSLDISNRALTLHGTFSGASNAGLKGSSSSDLAISGNVGTINFTTNNAILRNFTVNASGTVTMGNNVTIHGNWTNNGTYNHGNNTVTFASSASQILAGVTNFHDLFISNSGIGLTLNASQNVANILNMMSGIVETSGFTLFLGSSNNTGTLSGGSAGSHVNGKLARWINAATGNRVFSVGNGSQYRPIQINYTAAPTAGYLTASYVSGTPGTAGLPQTYGGILCELVSPTGYWQMTDDGPLNGGIYTAVVDATGFRKSDGLTNITDLSGIRLAKRPENGSWADAATAGAPSNLNAVSASGMSGFSVFGLIGTLGALPVELIGFNAAKRNKEVALDWSTASEQDNDFFAIERSNNGNDYYEIGQVEGKGTTLLTSRYIFMDKTPTSGDNYYRLRQVDFNAEFAYSPVRVVRMEQGTSYQVFPTLVSNTLTVRASDISEEDLQLSIISTANGQLISIQTMIAGNTQSEINTESLPQGSYMLQLTKRNEVQHFMFIKQ